MPNKRVLVSEKVQHFEKSNLIELCELFIRNQQILILEASQSPKMGKPLNRSFLLGIAVSLERTLYCFSELIWKIFAECHD